MIIDVDCMTVLDLAGVIVVIVMEIYSVLENKKLLLTEA